MTENPVTIKAREACSKAIEELGFELVDVEYVKEYGNFCLNFYIFSRGGTSLDDCTNVHNAIDPLLEECDPTGGKPYMLCVSSMGLDRPIRTEKDFNRLLGIEIDVKLYAPFNGRKEYMGTIVSCEDNKLVLSVGGENMLIDLKSIAIARQHI